MHWAIAEGAHCFDSRQTNSNRDQLLSHLKSGRVRFGISACRLSCEIEDTSVGQTGRELEEDTDDSDWETRSLNDRQQGCFPLRVGSCRIKRRPELTFEILPYKLPSVPTTNEPMADVMSDRFTNALAEKWFDAQPAQAIATMMGCKALVSTRTQCRLRDLASDAWREQLTISFAIHGC